MIDNVLSTHAMYCIFTSSGDLLSVVPDFQSADKFLTERVSTTPDGKMEMLKLARLAASAEELSLLLMGKGGLAVENANDVVVLSTGWFARPEFSTWFHKVPKTTVVSLKVET